MGLFDLAIMITPDPRSPSPLAVLMMSPWWQGAGSRFRARVTRVHLRESTPTAAATVAATYGRGTVVTPFLDHRLYS